MIEVEIRDPKKLQAFRELLHVIGSGEESQRVNKTSFYFDPLTVSFNFMHSNSTMLSDIQLDTSAAFDHYRCDRSAHVQVSAKAIAEIARSACRGDHLAISLHGLATRGEPETMTISVIPGEDSENTVAIHAELRVIVGAAGPIHEVRCVSTSDAVAQFTTKALVRAFSTFSDMKSDAVQLTVDHTKFSLGAGESDGDQPISKYMLVYQNPPFHCSSESGPVRFVMHTFHLKALLRIATTLKCTHVTIGIWSQVGPMTAELTFQNGKYSVCIPPVLEPEPSSPPRRRRRRDLEN